MSTYKLLGSEIKTQQFLFLSLYVAYKTTATSIIFVFVIFIFIYFQLS